MDEKQERKMLEAGIMAAKEAARRAEMTRAGIIGGLQTENRELQARAERAEAALRTLVDAVGDWDYCLGLSVDDWEVLYKAMFQARAVLPKEEGKGE